MSPIDKDINTFHQTEKDGGGGKPNGSVRSSSDDDNESMGGDGHDMMDLMNSNRHGHQENMDVKDDEILINEQMEGDDFEQTLIR